VEGASPVFHGDGATVLVQRHPEPASGAWLSTLRVGPFLADRAHHVCITLQMPSSEGVAKILSQAQKAQQAQKDGANQEEIDDAVSDAVRMLQQERALRERAAKDAMALGQGDPIAKAKDTALNALKVVGYLPYNIMAGTWNALRVLVTDPKRAGANIKEGWGHFKEVMQHYWLGSKLLAADVRTATLLLSRVLSGHSLSRRERKQLLRTVTDVLRLVPFAVFVLVPFMELLLPVALKLFPNMLPSTFKSTLEREEEKKRQLQARLAMASFLQEAVREQAQSISKKGKAESADELLMLFDAMRQGEAVPADAISRAAKVFSDELTLDNMPRAQLSAMAQYMGLPSYGSDAMLRFQLRNHLRVIKQDDQVGVVSRPRSGGRARVGRVRCSQHGIAHPCDSKSFGRESTH